MEFTFHFTPIKFDSQLYIQDVRDELLRVFRRAAQRFLVATVPKLKYFTGFTRGAFRNLEDIEGVGAVAKGKIDRRRKGSKNDTVGVGRYYYYPPGGGRVLRTPEAGRSFSTSGEQNIFKIARGRVNFYFIFNVKITYFAQSGWGKIAWDAGKKAFKDYVDKNTKLPKPSDERYFHA